MDDVIERSEKFAKKMGTVAHYYDHANQVRIDAAFLGREEGLNDREVFLLKVAALWHDVGLDYVDVRSNHPDKAVGMFLGEFDDESDLTDDEKKVVCLLIKYHDNYKEANKITGDEKMLKMLRILIDADTLELLGERGYTRAVDTAESRGWPKFDSDNPLGETYGFSADQFDKRFAQKRNGELEDVIEPTLVGQLNFQISCADLLHTESAKKRSREGVTYLEKKIKELVLDK